MRIFASSLLRDFNSVFGRPLLSVTAVITSEVFEVNKNPRDPPWEGKAFVQRLWEKCIDNVE